MEQLAEFFVKIGVKLEGLRGLTGLNQKISELSVRSVASMAGIYGLGNLIFKLGGEAVRTAMNYKLLNAEFGINAQWLQKMQYLGAQNNITAQQMARSSMGLTQNIAAFSLGMGSSSFLQAAGFLGLHMHPGMSQQSVLKELAVLVPEFLRRRKAMGDVNAAAEASTLLTQLGIDPALIQLLQRGKYKLPTQAPTMGKAEIAEMTAFGNALNVLGRKLHFLSYGVLEPIFEILLPMVNTLSSFTKSGWWPKVGEVSQGIKGIEHTDFKEVLKYLFAVPDQYKKGNQAVAQTNANRVSIGGIYLSQPDSDIINGVLSRQPEMKKAAAALSRP